MSVQFDENSTLQQVQYATLNQAPKGITGRLISWGVAKDKKGANMVLLIAFGILLIISIIFFAQLGGNDVVVDITPEERLELERMGAEI